VKKVKGNVDVM